MPPSLPPGRGAPTLGCVGAWGYGRDMSDSNTYSTDPAQETLGDTLGGTSASSTEKDPAEWVTGDEPMTGAQRSYLDTLAREAGEELPAELTKAEASEHIERLQAASKRVS